MEKVKIPYELLPTESGTVQSPTSYTDKNTGMTYTIYSTTGKKYGAKKYDQVADTYLNKNQNVEGFKVTPSGSPVDVVRGFYESKFNQPMQQAAKAVDQPILDLTRWIQSKTGGQELPAELKGPFQTGAEMVNTPESLGAVAGMIASEGITPNVSLAPRMLRSAIGTGLGYAAGQGLNIPTTPTQAMEPLFAAALSAAGEGAAGLFRTITNQSVSQQAYKGMATNLMQHIKERYPAVARQGIDGLDAIMSTDKGVREVTQIGMRAFRESANEYANSFNGKLNNLLPNTLPRKANDTVNYQMKLYVNLVDKWFESIDDVEKQAAITEQMNVAIKTARDAVSDSFTGTKNAPALVKFNTQISDFNRQFDDLLDGARLMQLMRESGLQTGFSPEKFQKGILEKLKYDPGYLQQSSFMTGVGDIAFRGGSPGVDQPSRVGVDLSRIVSLPNVPFLKRFAGGTIGPKIGTRYVGQFPPDLAGTTVTVPAIKQFLNREKKNE